MELERTTELDRTEEPSSIKEYSIMLDNKQKTIRMKPKLKVPNTDFISQEGFKELIVLSIILNIHISVCRKKNRNKNNRLVSINQRVIVLITFRINAKTCQGRSSDPLSLRKLLVNEYLF